MFSIKNGIELKQWSTGNLLLNPHMVEGDTVRFVSGSGMVEKSQAYKSNGEIVVDVPNSILTTSHSVRVELIGRPECACSFPVKKQRKPDNYVPVDNTKNFPKNQPDLSQNDPNAADYVKNRTHYEAEEIVNEPLNITWDGNTEGLVSVLGVFYKVSDLVLTDEQIQLITVRDSSGNTSTIDNYCETAEDITIFGFPAKVSVVKKDNVELEGVVFPKKGIYFMSTEGIYISSITTTEPVPHTKTVVKKLDKKFLPKATTLYGFDNRLYHDEECTRKVSAAELDDMIFVGGVLLNVDGYLHFPLIYEYDATYGSAISYMTYEDGIQHALTLEADNDV